MCTLVAFQATQVLERLAAFEALQTGDGAERFGVDELLVVSYHACHHLAAMDFAQRGRDDVQPGVRGDRITFF